MADKGILWRIELEGGNLVCLAQSILDVLEELNILQEEEFPIEVDPEDVEDEHP